MHEIKFLSFSPRPRLFFILATLSAAVLVLLPENAELDPCVGSPFPNIDTSCALVIWSGVRTGTSTSRSHPCPGNRPMATESTKCACEGRKMDRRRYWPAL